MDSEPTNSILSCRLCSRPQPVEPCLLPCLHIFCKVCLSRWATVNQTTSPTQGQTCSRSSKVLSFVDQHSLPRSQKTKNASPLKLKLKTQKDVQGGVKPLKAASPADEKKKSKKGVELEEEGYEVPIEELENWYEEVDSNNSTDDDPIYYNRQPSSLPSPPCYLPMDKHKVAPPPTKQRYQAMPLASRSSNESVSAPSIPSTPGYLRMDLQRRNNSAGDSTLPTPPPRRSHIRSGAPLLDQSQLTSISNAGKQEKSSYDPGSRGLLHDIPSSEVDSSQSPQIKRWNAKGEKNSVQPPKLTRRPRKSDSVDKSRVSIPQSESQEDSDGQSNLDKRFVPSLPPRKPSDNELESPRDKNGLEVKIPLSSPTSSRKSSRVQKPAAALPGLVKGIQGKDGETSDLSNVQSSTDGYYSLDNYSGASDEKVAHARDANSNESEDLDMYVPPELMANEEKLENYYNRASFIKATVTDKEKLENYYNRATFNKAGMKDSKEDIICKRKEDTGNHDLEQNVHFDDEGDEEDFLNDTIPAYESFKRASRSESIVEYDSYATLPQDNNVQQELTERISSLGVQISNLPEQYPTKPLMLSDSTAKDKTALQRKKEGANSNKLLDFRTPSDSLDDDTYGIISKDNEAVVISDNKNETARAVSAYNDYEFEKRVSGASEHLNQLTDKDYSAGVNNHSVGTNVISSGCPQNSALANSTLSDGQEHSVSKVSTRVKSNIFSDVQRGNNDCFNSDKATCENVDFDNPVQNKGYHLLQCPVCATMFTIGKGADVDLDITRDSKSDIVTVQPIKKQSEENLHPSSSETNGSHFLNLLQFLKVPESAENCKKYDDYKFCLECSERRRVGFQCMTCRNGPIICQDCSQVGGAHVGHMIAPLQEIANRDRELIKVLLNKVEPCRSRANEEVDRLKSRSQKWEDERKSAVAAILDQKQLLITMVDQYCAETIAAIEVIGEEENLSMNSEILSADKHNRHITDSIEFSRVLLDRGRDCDVALISQHVRRRLSYLRRMGVPGPDSSSKGPMPGHDRASKGPRDMPGLDRASKGSMPGPERASKGPRDMGTRTKIEFRPVNIEKDDIAHIVGFLSVKSEPAINPEEVISKAYEERILLNSSASGNQIVTGNSSYSTSDAVKTSTSTKVTAATAVNATQTTAGPIEPVLLHVFATRTLTDSKGCKPTGLALTDCNQIVLVDDINKKIKLFTPEGELKAEFEPEGEARLVDPWDLTILRGQANSGEAVLKGGANSGDAVLRGGAFCRVAVTDRGAKDVKIFQFENKAGRASIKTGGNVNKNCHSRNVVIKFLYSFGKEHLARPWGVATNSLRHVLVTDTEHHKVFVFAEDGKLLHTIPSFASNSTSQNSVEPEYTPNSNNCIKEYAVLKCPEYVTTNSNDDFIVSDVELKTIIIYDRFGRFLYCYDTSSSIGPKLKVPCGLAVDLDGFIYVADYGGSRVVKLNSEGDFVCSYEASDGRLVQPQTLVFNSKGQMVLVDRTQVKVFDIGIKPNKQQEGINFNSVMENENIENNKEATFENTIVKSSIIVDDSNSDDNATLRAGKPDSSNRLAKLTVPSSSDTNSGFGATQSSLDTVGVESKSNFEAPKPETNRSTSTNSIVSDNSEGAERELPKVPVAASRISLQNNGTRRKQTGTIAQNADGEKNVTKSANSISNASTSNTISVCSKISNILADSVTTTTAITTTNLTTSNINSRPTKTEVLRTTDVAETAANSNTTSKSGTATDSTFLYKDSDSKTEKSTTADKNIRGDGAITAKNLSKDAMSSDIKSSSDENRNMSVSTVTDLDQEIPVPSQNTSLEMLDSDESYSEDTEIPALEKHNENITKAGALSPIGDAKLRPKPIVEHKYPASVETKTAENNEKPVIKAPKPSFDKLKKYVEHVGASVSNVTRGFKIKGYEAVDIIGANDLKAVSGRKFVHKTKSNPSLAETKSNPSIAEAKSNPAIAETKSNPSLAETKSHLSVAEIKTNPPVVEANSNQSVATIKATESNCNTAVGSSGNISQKSQKSLASSARTSDEVDSLSDSVTRNIMTFNTVSNQNSASLAADKLPDNINSSKGSKLQSSKMMSLDVEPTSDMNVKKPAAKSKSSDGKNSLQELPVSSVANPISASCKRSAAQVAKELISASKNSPSKTGTKTPEPNTGSSVRDLNKIENKPFDTSAATHNYDSVRYKNQDTDRVREPNKQKAENPSKDSEFAMRNISSKESNDVNSDGSKRSRQVSEPPIPGKYKENLSKEEPVKIHKEVLEKQVEIQRRLEALKDDAENKIMYRRGPRSKSHDSQTTKSRRSQKYETIDEQGARKVCEYNVNDPNAKSDVHSRNANASQEVSRNNDDKIVIENTKQYFDKMTPSRRSDRELDKRKPLNSYQLTKYFSQDQPKSPVAANAKVTVEEPNAHISETRKPKVNRENLSVDLNEAWNPLASNLGSPINGPSNWGSNQVIKEDVVVLRSSRRKLKSKNSSKNSETGDSIENRSSSQSAGSRRSVFASENVDSNKNIKHSIAGMGVLDSNIPMESKRESHETEV